MAKIGFFLLLAVAFVLLFIMEDCHVTGTEVNHVDSILELDPKDVPLSKDGNVSNENLGKGPPNVDSPKVEQGQNGKVQNEVQLENRGDTDSKKNDSSKDLDSKQNHKVEEDKKSEDRKSGLDGKNKKSDSMNEGLGSKAVPGEDTKDGESDLSKTSSKENPQLEECDVSNRHSCVDEKKKLVACLRVPGNESPHLSLLVQNKGSGSLEVDITASDSIQLEQTMFRLQEKENRKVKVKVSIENGSNDTVIVLTAGYGRCELDFRDMVFPDTSKKVEYTPTSTYSSQLRRNLAIYLFIAVVLIIGAAWACLTLRRRHDDPRYQKVETELPISSGGKMEIDESADGWDNSWGDNWDDEEAPKTPSRLIANLSSKGLTPRRSNYKDGWQNSWKD